MLSSHSRPEASEISLSSVYFVWRLFTERNVYIGHINTLKNFSHDLDLTAYLQHLTNDYKKEISLLAEILNKYSINSSDPAPEDLNIKSSSAPLLDQEIVEVVNRFMKSDISILFLNLMYTPINEKIEETILKLAKNAISRIDAFIKFMKLKNWLFFPPVYPGIPKDVKEKVAVNEAFLLWEHLIFRYNTIRLVQVYLPNIKDKDLLSFMQNYIKAQTKEAKRLEDKLLYFGVILPQTYPDEISESATTPNFDEMFAFNSFLFFLHDGVSLHGSTFHDAIMNDGLRDYFIKITNDEITFMLNLSKMGREKGWANIVPGYQIINP